MSTSPRGMRTAGSRASLPRYPPSSQSLSATRTERSTWPTPSSVSSKAAIVPAEPVSVSP